MMTASHVFSLALVATSLYLVSATIFDNPTPATSVRFMQQTPAISFTSRKMDDFPDQKKADWMQRELDSKEQDSKHSEDFSAGEEEEDEAVYLYHTDYHGVTTHPAPTPKKHIKP